MSQSANFFPHSRERSPKTASSWDKGNAVIVHGFGKAAQAVLGRGGVARSGQVRDSSVPIFNQVLRGQVAAPVVVDADDVQVEGSVYTG